MTDVAAREAFAAWCSTERVLVEKRCSDLLLELGSQHRGMADAVSYSLLGGGKRLRPILCLWTHDMVGGTRRDAALDAACAVECIHTYSLIHDDLPCMDDDDLRRGKPSSHKKFGEAAALLAGDALLTLAFHVLATIPRRFPSFPAADANTITEILASAAGTGGMISGQALDLEATGRGANERQVREIHRNKTARLISAAMETGAVIGGAGNGLRSQIREAGMLAGESFQIIDDILDLESDRETLGKTPGKDAREQKPTYPSVVGVEAARSRARDLIERAKSIISKDKKGLRINTLMDYFVDRLY